MQYNALHGIPLGRIPRRLRAELGATPPPLPGRGVICNDLSINFRSKKRFTKMLGCITMAK